MDKDILKRAESIYFDLKWQSGMPQYLTLGEKNAMWTEALQKAKSES